MGLALVNGNMESQWTHKERIQQLNEQYRSFADTFLRSVHIFFPALQKKTVYLSRVDENNVYYYCGSTSLIFPRDIVSEETESGIGEWSMIIDHDTARRVDEILSEQQKKGRVSMSVHAPKRIIFQRSTEKTWE